MTGQKQNRENEQSQRLAAGGGGRCSPRTGDKFKLLAVNMTIVQKVKGAKRERERERRVFV